MRIHFRFAAAALFLIIAQFAYAQPNGPKPKELAPAVQIYFDLNKSEVKKSEKVKLDKLMQDLKSKKEYKVVLTGHTDSLGNDAFNMELSENRVDNVYDYLVEVGIDTSVVAKSYFGRSRPREGNEDEEKRAKNRRVEITIIEKPKPVEKPKPKPVVKDTCTHDTTVFIGQGISMTMNKCEYTKLCKGKGSQCFKVNRKTTIDEIFESGVALKTVKGEGFNWAGIVDVTIPSDSCFKNPASFSFGVDLETYKKAKLAAYKSNSGSLELDKNTRVRITRNKTEIKIIVPIKCSGSFNICGNAGKNKLSKFKDKTKKIEEIYVVSGSPNTIIPTIKKGKFWYVNYGSITEPKLYIKLKDGETMIQDIDLNSIRKSKKKGELRSKYKIKSRHIKG